MIASLYSEYLADGANLVAIIGGLYALFVFIGRNKAWVSGLFSDKTSKEQTSQNAPASDGLQNE